MKDPDLLRSPVPSDPTPEVVGTDLLRGPSDGEAALQAERLEALGNVAGAVAHEFNNLLTVVLANLEPLKRGADERTLRRLSRAQDAAQRSARIVHQVLAFARRQGADAEDADVRDVLAGLDALMPSAAGASVRVVLDLPDHPYPARLQVGRLEAELLRLAWAARERMRNGGELRLAVAEEDTEGPRLLVTHAAQGAATDLPAPVVLRFQRAVRR